MHNTDDIYINENMNWKWRARKGGSVWQGISIKWPKASFAVRFDKVTLSISSIRVATEGGQFALNVYQGSVGLSIAKSNYIPTVRGLHFFAYTNAFVVMVEEGSGP